MAFSLSGLFQGSSTSTESLKQTTTTTSATNSNHGIVNALRSFSVGQTVQGEVTGINGNYIELMLSEDVSVVAKLEGNVNVSIGQLLNFEITGKTDGQTLLRPLFENTATDVNLLKALDEANLPVNNRTVEMVKSLMEEGMPVDKQSLRSMFTQSSRFPESPISELVQMKALGLSITKENIVQFEAYRNQNHQLINTATAVAGEMSEMLSSVASSGNHQEAFVLFAKLMSVLGESSMQAGVQTESLAQTTHLQNPEAQLVGNQMAELQANQQSGNSQTTVNLQANPQENDNQMVNLHSAEGMTEDNAFIQNQGIEQLIQSQETLQNGDFKQGAVNGQPSGSDAQLNIENIIKEFSDALLKAGISEKEITTLLQGKSISENLAGKVENLFSFKELNTKINDKLLAEWTISPKQVASEKEIESLYVRLRDQMAKMTEIMSDTGKGTEAFAKTIQNVSDNLNFMQQINQTYAYVQLPLKMTGGNTHGDLYVYTDKKHLAQADGKVTALLHLDMTHLGMVDVYVAMEDKKVNTNFRLEKEEYLYFIEEHMNMLNQRLQKRGYQATCSAQINESKTDIIEEMLHAGKSGGPVLLSAQAFDVRA